MVLLLNIFQIDDPELPPECVYRALRQCNSIRPPLWVASAAIHQMHHCAGQPSRTTGPAATLAMVSLDALSIRLMTGWWIILVFGSVALVLVTLNFTLRWSSNSGPAALTGMSGVLLAFVVVGTLVEATARKAAWVRDDPDQLWLGIITAFICFTLGALKAAPWVVTRAVAERDQGAHSPSSLTNDPGHSASVNGPRS